MLKIRICLNPWNPGVARIDLYASVPHQYETIWVEGVKKIAKKEKELKQKYPEAEFESFTERFW